MTAITSSSDDPAAAPGPPRMGRPGRWMAAAVALAAVAVGIGLWLFFAGDTPDEVSLDDAIGGLDTQAGDGSADATGVDASGAAGSIAGQWIIDTETGEFDDDAATGSFAGFRIEEELRSIGSTTAVGRTGAIAGSMTVDGTTVTAASFEIDLTTITTDDSRRDDNVQDALETGSFPTASFVLTSPIELGDGAASGESVSVTGAGDMTIHGVTNPVEFAIDAQLVDGLVVAVGSTTMTFADFGVEVPDGGPVISVDDVGVVEFQFLLRQAG